jgi:hypothetical protein
MRLSKIAFAFVLVFSAMFSGRASGMDNKRQVQDDLMAKHKKVIFGKELSHADYLEFLASFAGGPAGVAVYLEGLAVQAVQETGIDVAQDTLVDIFAGKRGDTIIGGEPVYVGIATYNHWSEQGGGPFPRWKMPEPNTHQFYVAIGRKDQPNVDISKYQLFAADFDGDGKADRVLVNPEGGWFVLTATGECGLPTIPWGSKIPGWPGDGFYLVADFDGDGKADRMFIHPDGKEFAVSTASGAPGMPGFPWGSSPPGFPGSGPLARYFAADVNGDKKADLIMLRRSDARWFPIAGGSGAPIKTEPGFVFGDPAAPGWPGDGFYLVADFDGDGKADRAYLNQEGRWFVVSAASGAPGVSGIPWSSLPLGWPRPDYVLEQDRYR